MTQAFLDKYGDPDKDHDGSMDADWFVANIRKFKLPCPLQLTWGTCGKVEWFQAHRLVGDKIIAALNRVLVAASILALGDAYEDSDDLMRRNAGLRYLEENKLNQWGGCFNWRPAKESTLLSMHAFAVAIDFNPAIGRFKNVEDAKTYPKWIVNAFKQEGFTWGGDESWIKVGRCDPMHFEYTKV